jgi:hypothetical protein
VAFKKPLASKGVHLTLGVVKVIFTTYFLFFLLLFVHLKERRHTMAMCERSFTSTQSSVESSVQSTYERPPPLNPAVFSLPFAHLIPHGASLTSLMLCHISALNLCAAFFSTSAILKNEIFAFLQAARESTDALYPSAPELQYSSDVPLLFDSSPLSEVLRCALSTLVRA